MILMKEKIVYLICLLCVSSGVFAQVKRDSITINFGEFDGRNGATLQLEDSSIIKLPPVEVLIENAKGSAQVMFYQTQKEIDERELKSIRRKWLEFFKLNGSYQYGITNSYFMYSESGVPYPPSDKYTNQAQSYFLVGGGVSIPLLEIFNRGNRIKKQKLITKQQDYQAQMWHDDQALKIIECYSLAMENIVLIRPLLEDYYLSKAQFAVSEVDFIQGKLNIQEFNKQKTILVKSMVELQRNKMTLMKNLMQLEILSNTPIITRAE